MRTDSIKDLGAKRDFFVRQIWRIEQMRDVHLDSIQVQYILIAPSRCKFNSVHSFHKNDQNVCA